MLIYVNQRIQHAVNVLNKILKNSENLKKMNIFRIEIDNEMTFLNCNLIKNIF